MYLIANGGISSMNNTTDAIMLTKNLPYLDGVKLDVRMSKDNILVLSRLNELSFFTFSNKKIDEVDYAYLKKVKFHSHIFKYYIPTLDEILKNYNYNKIIVLELYENNRNDLFLQQLISLLSKYSYNYYFYSSNKMLLESLKEFGTIIDKYTIKNQDIITDDLIITNNPLKYNKINNSTK